MRISPYLKIVPRQMIIALMFAGVLPWALIANMRAPQTVPGESSSALSSAAQAAAIRENLEVRGEDLAIQCAALPICSVTATYRLHAETGANVALQFVVGRAKSANARITVNDRAVPARIIANAGDDRDFGYSGAARSPRDPLPEVELGFTARLVRGDNTIIVQYDQTLPQIEVGYGYFNDGKMVHMFRYEFAPLRDEWKTAPDFRLDFSIAMAEARPNWFMRRFVDYTEVQCNFRSAGGDSNEERENRSGRYTYSGSFAMNEIADVIHCDVGPASHTRRTQGKLTPAYIKQQDMATAPRTCASAEVRDRPEYVRLLLYRELRNVRRPG